MFQPGIIGGLGPESTIDYYRSIIKYYQFKKNGEQYPEIIFKSLDLSKALSLVSDLKLKDLTNYLVDSIKSLQKTGADFAAIAANTPHIVFDEVQSLSPIPLISIVEETAKIVKDLKLEKVGLFGTKFTMETDFYKDVMLRNGIKIVVPKKGEQVYIHKKILSELEHGKILNKTKEDLLRIVKRMIKYEEIEGLILGCTELPLILTRDEFGISFLNTTKIHVRSIVNKMLQ